MSAETGNSKIGVKKPRRNGLFLIDDGFRSSGRLDGGGSSRAKPVSYGYQGKIQGERENWPEKSAAIAVFALCLWGFLVKNEFGINRARIRGKQAHPWK